MNNFLSFSQAQFIFLFFMPLTESFEKIAYNSKKSVIPPVYIYIYIYASAKYSQ